jgi:hypothetical protein
MRLRGVARPDGAHFTRCIVTDSEDEVHLRGTVFSELIPALAAQPLGVDTLRIEQRNCVGVRRGSRMAARAVPDETVTGELIKRGLGKDRARRVVGAKE